MKILTFNIRQGGGDRVAKIIETLFTYEADTIILTEFRENKNSNTIRKALYENGYTFYSSSIIEKNINGVFIASKKKFISSTFPLELQHDSHRALLAKFVDINILGVYFAQKDEKKLLFDFINNTASKFLGEYGLIIGDFNTGKHYIDEPKATFSCHSDFEKLEISGLIDSWRSRHITVKEFSWYSHAGNGFRIDHVFSTPSLDKKIVNINYSHKEREEKISDHSILFLEYLN